MHTNKRKEKGIKTVSALRSIINRSRGRNKIRLYKTRIAIHGKIVIEKFWSDGVRVHKSWFTYKTDEDQAVLCWYKNSRLLNHYIYRNYWDAYAQTLLMNKERQHA